MTTRQRTFEELLHALQTTQVYLACRHFGGGFVAKAGDNDNG